MILAVQKADSFKADFERQFAWYVENAGDAVAWRFQAALDTTLLKLARQPDFGRPRRFRHPLLRDLRSSPLTRPFNRLLIFYRVRGAALQAWRLLHGARDLPRRLVE
jgi:plasmid stabilization system protein ParE